MNGSLHTTIRRAGLALAATASAAVFAGSALAGQDRPASSYYTPQQLQGMSTSWAAKGRLLGSPNAASFYTREQLQALSTNWAAKGRLLGIPDAASFYTPQQLQAMSANWAAKGRPLGTTTPTATAASGFDWSDFGLGAAAMLGLVLLGGGLVAGAHLSRKSGMRARSIS
jgi:hypothetical protein